MTGFLTVLGQVLAVAGAGVLLLAAIGLLRFADFYMRASAVATATGVGISLIIIGSVLVAPGVADAVKAAVAVVLQLVTSAAGGIMLARCALLSGHRFSPDTDSAALRSVTGPRGPAQGDDG
ncbi:monovalent cation/H(+) antiporter subunit G [Pseudonocardia nematodicida]|uniref:Monovalent cation/H(+) antiporter subunit G n=1 Tax=Pseudonocardia nematodicida TaxID=1206997 RepID=A0ABV1KHG6_9PSEU